MTFQFNFTADVLDSCINNTNSTQWFQDVFDILSLSDYEITSKLRFAAWIAQCGHESMDFKTLEENLNYRSAALLAVFPTHFTAVEADVYQHNPQKIANRVYANRMGNGDEASGDGWLFHGRGLIQITGRDNYTAMSQSMYGDTRLLTNPELLVQTDGAVRSACWVWQTNELNALADSSSFEIITRKINGGTTGEPDRLDRYQHAISVLNSVADTAPVATAVPVLLSVPVVQEPTVFQPTNSQTPATSRWWNVSTWFSGGNAG